MNHLDDSVLYLALTIAPIAMVWGGYKLKNMNWRITPRKDQDHGT